MGGIRLECKKKGIRVDCLAFADDIVLLSESVEEAVNQTKELQRQAAKTGLQISIEKTKYMTNIMEAPGWMAIDGGKIQKVEKFKYLGEWIDTGLTEKDAMEAQINKINLAYKLTMNIYNKKNISINAKLKHYQTVIRPEALYAAETLNLIRTGVIKRLELVERKILRRILGPRRTEYGQFRNQSNQEIYSKIEKISDIIKKRRCEFFGHICRMDQERLTQQISQFLLYKKSKIPGSKKYKGIWKKWEYRIEKYTTG